MEIRSFSSLGKLFFSIRLLLLHCAADLLGPRLSGHALVFNEGRGTKIEIELFIKPSFR